jgi:TetR/AcrR family transcriptional regulator
MTDKPKRSRIQIRNEEAILAAARTVFAQSGFRGATLERIAELADMSQPNLHHYFKTKSDLYAAVLGHTLDIWLQPLESFDPDGDPRTEITRYIEAKLELSRREPDASRVFAYEMLDGGSFLRKDVQTRVKHHADHFAATLTRWSDDGKMRKVDPHHLLFLIWASTQHYADFAPQVRFLSGESRLSKACFQRIRDSLCSIVLNGIFEPVPT